MASRNIFRGLQSLRAVAAILVLVTHSGFYVSERLSPGFHYWRRGAAGVDLFFVLSGFVMVFSSLKLASDPNGWKVFTARRVSRIVPIYWVATTIKLVVLLFGSSFILHQRFQLLNTVESYLFIPFRNIDGEFRPLLGVGWTLNFEMFFYLLFAFALRCRVNIFGFISAILVPLAVSSVFMHSAQGPVAFYMNPIILDFLFGMLIARAVMSRIRLCPLVAIGMIVLGILGLLVVPLPDCPGVSLEGIASTLIIWGTAELEPKLAWIPSWLVFMGDASYALYLFHPLIAPSVPVMLHRMNLPLPFLSICLSGVIAVVVSAIVYKLVEIPLTRFAQGLVRPFQMQRSASVQSTREVS